jgi:polyhydroxyalkanoate synthase
MFDWLAHLAISPAKRIDNVKKANEKFYRFGMAIAHCLPFNNSLCLKTQLSDIRFKNELWQRIPFIFYAQGFLLCEQWWDEITSNDRGVSRHHKQVVNFITRQVLDIFSPSNFILTNPEVLERALQSSGVNFIRGFNNFLEDLTRQILKEPPVGVDNFKIGVNVAITPGKVIFRNRLIELIQYEPTTRKVYAEPVLIIPAWIMKYYILDLSPHNSLVKYLVEHGHTVFMISWKNPGSEDRDLGFEDYLNLGIMESLTAINQILPRMKIHCAGYCIGGTLLMLAAAAMAGNENNQLKTVTTFAAQIDFKEAGELQLFIDQSQITFLEDIMWEKGYLDGTQMANAFSMLHSNDLVWSRVIRDYFLDERRPMTDLMAWDADTTRLPFRMHSEYLHNLFLNNDLVHGRFKVNRKKIALADINAPIFSVATVTDHISPWKSVYKIHLFTDTAVTFVLTTGGHNAGIVSEPGHPRRSYQMQTRKKDAKYINPESWQEIALNYEGSWWPAWENWLVTHSSQKIPPPSMGKPKKGYPILTDAPGEYVAEK